MITSAPTFPNVGRRVSARTRSGRPVTQQCLLAGLTVAAAATLGLRPRGAQASASAPPSRTRAVRVRIATDRVSYGAGDTIGIRIALTNTGRVALEVSSVPPWRAVHLVVTGRDGRVVAPTLLLDGRFFRSTRGITLEPGMPLVASYGGQEWTALRSFGYGPLAPGRYRITAVPLVQRRDDDADVGTGRSNAVTITVAP